MKSVGLFLSFPVGHTQLLLAFVVDYFLEESDFNDRKVRDLGTSVLDNMHWYNTIPTKWGSCRRSAQWGLKVLKIS